MFWGLTIEPGKHYTQTVEESFHVSMAAMETRDHVSESGGEKTGLVQVIVKHEKTEFLVCSLYYGTVFQQPLDLNFTEGEEVTFFTEGRGIIHLTGYLVREEPLDIDQDMMSMEDASSSDDVSVSSEGMASDDQSPKPEAGGATKPRKRKKKRTRWKLKEAVKKDTAPGKRRNQWKRRKTEGSEEINPQRVPRARSDDVITPLKEVKDDFHTRGWTTSIVISNVKSTSRNIGSEVDKEIEVDKQRGSDDQSLSTCVPSNGSKTDLGRTSEEVVATPPAELVDRGGKTTGNVVNPSTKQQQPSAIGDVLQDTISRHSPALVMRHSPILVKHSPTYHSTQSPNVSKPQTMPVSRQSPTVSKPQTMPVSRQSPTVSRLSPTVSTLSPTVSIPSSSSPAAPKSPQLIGEMRSQSVLAAQKRVNHPPQQQGAKDVPSAATRTQNMSGSSVQPGRDNLNQHRTLADRSVVQQHQQRPVERLRTSSATMAAADASTQDDDVASVKEEEEEEVLIEEIKIEDDSSDDEIQPTSFSRATEASHSSTVQTLPRITSVTSIRNQHHHQQLMENQLIGASQPHQQFHGDPPPAWNLPGPSREQRPPQFMVPSQVPAHLHPPMPVALSRHGDPAIMGGSSGDLGQEMIDEEGIGLEDGEVMLSEEVLRAMPAATEMRDLTLEDMEVGGLDISQEQILLARGFNVFLTRGQLFEVQKASRETSKTPWSVCVRRLMDIYFDRQTLAMGKATSHGFSNNPDRKALNQEVIRAIKDEADVSLQQLANQDLSDEDSEEEDWAPGSASRRKPKSKAKKGDKGEEAASPSKRKRASGDADWIMWQPSERKSAKKARKTMAIAMATKHGLDLEEDSDSEDDVPGSNEKTNKIKETKDKKTPSKKEPKRQSVECITNIDDDTDDGGKVVAKKMTKKERKAQRKKVAAAAATAAKDDDVQIVGVTKGESSDGEDDYSENDDEDYVPDKNVLKKTRVESETESSSEDEGKMDEAEFETGSDTDESEFEGNESGEEEEEESEEDDDEDDEDDEGYKNAAGVANGHPKKTPQQSKQAQQSGENNKAASSQKAKKKDGKKGVAMESLISSDKENQRTSPRSSPVKQGKESAKKEQSKEQKKVAKVKPTKKGPEVRKGGVSVLDTTQGAGKVATRGRMVSVYYRGKLASNNKQFDACQSGKAFAFRLGGGEVINGWDIGVVGMRVGGKRQITIPPSQGYGNKKQGPIPANSKLIFDVELRGVK